ncbi:MAG: DUF116 domain-containing protein [Deltaproteobacteria bacterium]|nr:DUF116 domain-containing protein [Deltaproteobacteria bacterium]
MADTEEKWRGSAESIQYKPGKGVFLGLLGVTSFVMVAAGFFFWYVPTIGLGNIHPALPYVLGALLLGVALFIVLGAVFITVAALRGAFIFRSSFRGLLVKFFLPIMLMVGGFLKIPRIKIEQAFIDINNQMVRLMGRRFRPEKLLILMPHCIQYDNCRIKVTRDVKNCAGCGRCEIGGLLTLSDEFGITLFISTGGTVARRKVYEERPDAVIAVACERDLTSGLQDAYPLPVIAIVNKRPRGYCMETGVAIEEVRQAILDLVGPGRLSRGGAAHART